MRGPEGDVAIIDVFHAGGGEYAVLLGSEIEEEATRSLVVVLVSDSEESWGRGSGLRAIWQYCERRPL